MTKQKLLVCTLALGLMAAPLAPSLAEDVPPPAPSPEQPAMPMQGQGMMGQGMAPGMMGQGMMGQGMGPGMHLSPANHEMMRETMKGVFEQNKPLMIKLQSLQEQVHTVMKAKDFDQGAYIALHQQMQKLQNEMQDNRTKAMSLTLAKLSPEERDAMVTAMQDHRPRMMHQGGMMKKHMMAKQAPEKKDQ